MLAREPTRSGPSRTERADGELGQQPAKAARGKPRSCDLAGRLDWYLSGERSLGTDFPYRCRAAGPHSASAPFERERIPPGLDERYGDRRGASGKSSRHPRRGSPLRGGAHAGKRAPRRPRRVRSPASRCATCRLSVCGKSTRRTRRRAARPPCREPATCSS